MAHRFTELPSEIRQLIYKNLFAYDGGSNPEGVEPPYPRGLISTNRQIRHEASFLYEVSRISRALIRGMALANRLEREDAGLLLKAH